MREKKNWLKLNSCVVMDISAYFSLSSSSTSVLLLQVFVVERTNEHSTALVFTYALHSKCTNTKKKCARKCGVYAIEMVTREH